MSYFLPTGVGTGGTIDIDITDVLIFKGVIPCNDNPDYPSAETGHTYKISVPGRIGGEEGPKVEIGDTLICLNDYAIDSGDHEAVGEYWTILQTNIDYGDGLTRDPETIKVKVDIGYGMGFDNEKKLTFSDLFLSDFEQLQSLYETFILEQHGLTFQGGWKTDPENEGESYTYPSGSRGHLYLIGYGGTLGEYEHDNEQEVGSGDMLVCVVDYSDGGWDCLATDWVVIPAVLTRASREEAEIGEEATKFMTPFLTKMAFKNRGGDGIKWDPITEKLDVDLSTNHGLRITEAKKLAVDLGSGLGFNPNGNIVPRLKNPLKVNVSNQIEIDESQLNHVKSMLPASNPHNVRTYIDGEITEIRYLIDNLLGEYDALVFRGIWYSEEYFFPEAKMGDVYKVGSTGNLAGREVSIGDTMICIADTYEGDYEEVGSNWFIIASDSQIASEQEARAGIDNTKIITPLQAMNFLDARVGKGLELSYEDNFLNVLLGRGLDFHFEENTIEIQTGDALEVDEYDNKIKLQLQNNSSLDIDEYNRLFIKLQENGGLEVTENNELRSTLYISKRLPLQTFTQSAVLLQPQEKLAIARFKIPNDYILFLSSLGVTTLDGDYDVSIDVIINDEYELYTSEEEYEIVETQSQVYREEGGKTLSILIHNKSGEEIRALGFCSVAIVDHYEEE